MAAVLFLPLNLLSLPHPYNISMNKEVFIAGFVSFYLFMFVWESLTSQTVLFKVLANNFLSFFFVLF